MCHSGWRIWRRNSFVPWRKPSCFERSEMFRNHVNQLFCNAFLQFRHWFTFNFHFSRDILHQYRGEGVKNAITTAFIGTSVITTYNNKVYKVDDVDFEVNPLSTFDKSGEQVSLLIQLFLISGEREKFFPCMNWKRWCNGLKEMRKKVWDLWFSFFIAEINCVLLGSVKSFSSQLCTKFIHFCTCFNVLKDYWSVKNAGFLLAIFWFLWLERVWVYSNWRFDDWMLWGVRGQIKSYGSMYRLFNSGCKYRFVLLLNSFIIRFQSFFKKFNSLSKLHF